MTCEYLRRKKDCTNKSLSCIVLVISGLWQETPVSGSRVRPVIPRLPSHTLVPLYVEGHIMRVYNYSITELHIQAIGFLLCPGWPQTPDPFASTD